MHSDLSSIGNILVLTGLGIYAYGSPKYRLPHAPIAFNCPRGWPWQHQDWFAPRGRRLRKIGLAFWSVGGATVIVGLLLIW